MNTVNKLLPNKKDKASTGDAVAAALAQAKREKDEMKAKYEAKIKALKKEVLGARTVMQAMVLVARISPEPFFQISGSSRLDLAPATVCGGRPDFPYTVRR